MEFEFADKRLLHLYTSEEDAEKYGDRLVEAFFDVMATVANAKDGRDIRRMKSLHYEKLKGKRSHERSLRLSSGKRLIVQERKDERGQYLLITGIEDYH